MITKGQCAMVHHIVVDSGASAMFNAHMRGPGGPTPRFDRSVYLIGWLLAVLAYQKSHIRLIHRVLLREVPLQWQVRWGVRWQHADADGTLHWRTITEADLQHASKRLRRVYNYTANHVPDRDEPGDQAHVRQRNQQALNSLIDALLAATLPARPTGAADYAMDSTGLWATERSRRPLPRPEQIDHDETSAGKDDDDRH